MFVEQLKIKWKNKKKLLLLCRRWQNLVFIKITDGQTWKCSFPWHRNVRFALSYCYYGTIHILLNSINYFIKKIHCISNECEHFHVDNLKNENKINETTNEEKKMWNILYFCTEGVDKEAYNNMNVCRQKKEKFYMKEW